MRLIALIFREWILPPSETFIIEQGKALRRYDPVLAGLCLKGSGNYAKIPQVLLTSRSGYLANAAVKAYRYTGFAPQFHRHLRSIHASIVHAHFATDAVSALLIAEYLDLPLVVTLHGYDVTTDDVHLARTLRGRHYLKRRRRLFERTTRFLCVSKSIRDAAARAGFPEEKLQVHYTGVDCERFQPNHVGRDPKLVLFVGRLVEKKGCQYLLSAMKQVRDVDPQAHLEIIGDGPLGPELKAMAAMFGIRANFRGVQNTEEVRRSMLRARVLCNPSVTATNGDCEGFGMVLAEAQAVGTPVVSSFHAAIPEVVNHGDTGLLCQERMPGELRDALLKFLKDDAFWFHASGRAVSWVRKNFDIAKQTRTLEGIYDQCIKVTATNRLSTRTQGDQERIYAKR